MAISITKPTNTFVLIRNFKINYAEKTQKLRFRADFGEGEKDCYDAVANVKDTFKWIVKNDKGEIIENNLTADDGSNVVLFRATLEEKDGHWHFTSLIRDEDNLEVTVQPLNLLAKAIANRKEVK